MVEDGTISTWNLKKDPKIIDEFIFDVNTEYFDRHGGYEYAKRFYEEAYRFAVAEVGGEEFVLSAVMHADERNRAVSEQLGRNVYHYHLHVMYVPVVDAGIRWTKRCKDPKLVGKVKAVVKQVSNSKKWKSEMVVGEDGKKRIAYSYAALQDRFHQHMNDAGYTDVERGERGSSAEHLSVLGFKIQQDAKRAAALEQDVQAKQKKSAELDRQTKRQQGRLSLLREKVKFKKQAAIMFSEIENMAKKSIGGKMQLSLDDWEIVSELAKKGVIADTSIADLERKLVEVQKGSEIYKQRWETLSAQTKDYVQAKQQAPEEMRSALATVMRETRERQALVIPTKQRSNSLER